MKFSFTVKDDGSIPVVYIDDARLSVVSLTYAWHTKTDKMSDSANICIVDGYFENTTVARRFLFNLSTGRAMEETILEENHERVFEVLTNAGESAETETWVKTPFADLKSGDIIRIIDADRYYRDLSNCGVWIVTETENIDDGSIEVAPFDISKVPTEVGHGEFLPGTVKPKMFPILGTRETVPWAVFEPHRTQAEINHHQTLERLAERGGLCWVEALAVLEDRQWTRMDEKEARDKAVQLIADKCHI